MRYTYKSFFMRALIVLIININQHVMRKTIISYLLFTVLALVSTISKAQTIHVEAESYTDIANSTKLVKEHGDSTVGYFDEKGEMLTYQITVATAGYYKFSMAYSTGDNGYIFVKTKDDAVGMINFVAVPYGNNWWENPVKNWPVIEKDVLFYLQAGSQNIYLISNGVGINFDFFDLKYSANQNIAVTKIGVSSNPVVVKPYRRHR